MYLCILLLPRHSLNGINVGQSNEMCVCKYIELSFLHSTYKIFY